MQAFFRKLMNEANGDRAYRGVDGPGAGSPRKKNAAADRGISLWEASQNDYAYQAPNSGPIASNIRGKP